MKRTGAKWCLGLLVAVSVAVYGYDMVRTIRDKQGVATMTAQMKTVCVGRFLIDLPAKAEYSITGAFVDGFHISVTDETREQFGARLTAREAEINGETNQLGNKNMEAVQQLDANGFTGKLFTFGRSSTYTFEGDTRRDWVSVKVEGYAHAGNRTFNFIADAYDPALVSNLGKLLRQLRSVPADKIPVKPGFCFGPGMLLDPIAAVAAEKVVMFAGFPGHPDVAVAFNTMAGLKRTWPTLLERRAKVAAERPLILRSLFSTLRAGPRTINGLAGEEMATKVTELNFSIVYGFDWELPGTEDDVLVPAIHLEMSTGNSTAPGGEPVQSSLHQEAALDLWDKIVASIRVRLTQATQIADAVQPAAPAIGTIATAGQPCPQNGWWMCGDAGDNVRVLGGARQYLRKGQMIPQALLMPPQTLWEKVRGVQRTYENKLPTLWKLADLRLRSRSTPTLPLAQPGPPPEAHCAPAAPVEVGTALQTGVPCPVSGWWRCQDMDALDDTRWFSSGSLLPPATFTVRDGSGASHPTFRRRTRWKLLRLAGQPEEEPAPPPPPE